MNRAERRQQKKGKQGQTGQPERRTTARALPGQARAHTERGLIRHMAQGKGRRP